MGHNIPQPEHCVDVYRDFMQRMLENMKRCIDTGEAIPNQVIREQIAEDWGIPPQLVSTVTFAGEMIILDRMFRNLPEAARERRYQQMNQNVDHFARELGYEDAKDFAIQQEREWAASRRELEDLEDLFTEEEL